MLGYYTLSMADVDSRSFPKKRARGLPASPMPIALIGRLAIVERARRRGYFGGRLLKDALTRVVLLSHQIGCFGVVVEAKDAAAARFYATFGFTLLGAETWPRRLFLALTTVLNAASRD